MKSLEQGFDLTSRATGAEARRPPWEAAACPGGLDYGDSEGREEVWPGI